MGDLREKQPYENAVDFRNATKGGEQYSARIVTFTYSGLKNEDVYSRILIAQFRADSFAEACGIAQVISGTIALAHDVWQTSVDGVWRGDS